LKKNPVNILIVGAEKSSEFKFAIGALKNGAKVTIVNPKAPTHSLAPQFIKAGGRYQQRSIQQLPAGSKYKIIMEEFPVPSGGMLEKAQRYVDARLPRLAVGGQWIVVTENSAFSRAIRAAADKRGFKVLRRRTKPSHEATPTSRYARESDRIVLIIFK